MIDSEGIYKKANSLVQFHGTRDPILISKASGIDVIPVDYFNDLLGMYVYRWKHRVIFLNDRMDLYLTKMVCGHELGEYCTIAAGAVVTKNVPAHALMAGVPARQIGWVCECGQVLDKELCCPDCNRKYKMKDDKLSEVK